MKLVEKLSALFSSTIARDLDFFLGEFVVVSEFLPGQNPALSEDDDVLETLGTANHARCAVRIARVVDETSGVSVHGCVDDGILIDTEHVAADSFGFVLLFSAVGQERSDELA